MKKLLIILLLFFPVYGAWAEKLQLQCDPKKKADAKIDLVIDTLSKNTPYGVKHYYSVIHFGYMWLCEQATYRTTCHPKQ